MQQQKLPLFPLQVVLLPNAQLPLHIFEERYKELIGEAIENKTEFGIVLASEKGIVNTGCTAVVDRVVRRYPDGRMDIIAVGRRRFEILMLDEEKSYLRGAVEYFDDDDFDAPSPEAAAKVQSGYQELRQLDDSEEELPEGTPLSFRVAQSIPDLNFRQTLLATRSEAERIRRLAEYLPALVERTRTAAHVRSIAPTNGHAKHLGF
jgi:Lon protease-like protein